MASGAAVSSGVHHPRAAGSCGPSPALRYRAHPGSQCRQQQDQAARGSCAARTPCPDTASSQATVTTVSLAGGGCICPWCPCQGELSSQENSSPQKTPPEPSRITPGASNSWGSPNYRRLLGSPGAAGARYLSVCHSWRAAPAHLPRAGLSVPAGGCSLMPSVCPPECGGRGRRAPPGRVSSPASPARGLTSLPSAAAPA